MLAGLQLQAGQLLLTKRAQVAPPENDGDEEEGSDGENVADGSTDPGPPVSKPVVPFDPDRPWEDLLSERVGFGATAIGGAGGELCVVTSLDDSGSNTLRDCVAKGSKGDRAVWAIFDVDGTITLDSPLRLGSNTTIDGRGASIRIRRHGLSISKDSNVIIHNIELSDIGGTDDSDALSVYAASDVWVDHVSFANSTDGLLDITKGSRAVTVSWCRFEDQNKTMLIGANPNHLEDKGTRVTLHHNYFYRTTRRNPFLRHGKVHAFNNVFREWGEGNGGDLIAVTFEAQFYAEKNVFDPGANRRAVRLGVGQKNSVAGYVAASGNGAKLAGRGYAEFPQHFPKPGWVEHELEESRSSVHEATEAALRASGLGTEDIRAIGITNQRETTCVWSASGAPLHRAIVWQDRRTAPRTAANKEAGHEGRSSRPRTTIHGPSRGRKPPTRFSTPSGASASAALATRLSAPARSRVVRCALGHPGLSRPVCGPLGVKARTRRKTAARNASRSV